jgi:RNA polymerase sigma-70 factor (ECF subfamily)
MTEDTARTAVSEDDDAAAESSTGAKGGYRASPQEALLLSRLRAGDASAFTAFVDQHHPGLVRLAMVFVGNRAVANEVVQETWAALVDGLARFEGRSSLKTWLLRILTNRAKTRAVREKRSVPFSALESDESEAGEPGRSGLQDRAPGAGYHDENPEAVFLRQEALRRLEEALSELPAAQRAVVVLRDVEGLESTEVCNVLQITETNQRVLLHRGRAKLRNVLEEVWGGV